MPVSPRLLTALAAVATALAVSTAPASADTLSVDFESGPAIGTPVNDDYMSSAFVRFDPNDPGYRPYRRDVGARARSGTVVADVGGDVCAPEAGNGNACEFAQSAMTARLTRTATSVTLYAGLFTASPGIGARLIGYDSNGGTVATGPVVPLPTNGLSLATRAGRAFIPPTPPRFTTPVTITSPAGNIAKFRLEAVDVAEPHGVNASSNATLGFDDLTLDYPANSLPDFSLSAGAQAAVLDGLTQDVPVTVTRLNASNGPIALTASGLPTGVSASFTPNPLPAAQTSATMHLTASSNAPRLDNPADVTVTADPQNDANVGIATRTAHTFVRVSAPFELRGDTTPASVNACGDTDVPIVVGRDITFNGTVHLAVSGLPTGVTADLLPNPDVPAGGNLNADRTLRVHVGPGASLPGQFTITASSPGAPNRTQTRSIFRSGSATLADPSQVAHIPQHMQPGTTVTVNGAGFCPGTSVNVGSPAGSAPATMIAADGRSLTFVTPRAATSGPVTIVPPATEHLANFSTPESLTVDNFRNTAGFAFHNPSYGYLSYGELTDAFGNDDMWITINPCWPFGNCRINTGIPDPLSYAEWGILNPILRGSGGHCFGITRAAEELRFGRVAYSRFAPGVHKAFDLPSSTGPNGALGDYLDGQHALQASAEFLHAYAHRDRNVGGQVDTANAELTAGRDPIVTMHHDDGSVFGVGHAVLAYDLQFVPGGVDIYVYDSNRQSTAAGDPGGTTDSVIHITQSNQRWSMTQANGDVWQGGGDGTLFIAPQSTIPANPSLPSLSSFFDLPALIFGAADGTAHVSGATPGATLVPVIDGGDATDGGTVVGTDPKQALGATIVGDKPGTYNAVVTGKGFTGAVNDVSTKPGVTDQAGGTSSGHELEFKSGADRSLEVSLATAPTSGGAARAGGGAGPTTSTAATVTTHASKGGDDTAGLTTRGQLSYAHDGSPTTFSFTLTTTTANGGPEQFLSPPVKVAGGDRVTATPGGGQTVSLTVRSRSGKTRHQTLRNRAKAPARLRLSGLKTAKSGSTRTVSVTATVSKLAPDSSGALGVVLRVMRGKRVVAHHEVSSSAAGAGATPVSWTLPKLAKGRYKLVVDARLAVGGKTPGSVTAHRTTALTLP